MEVTGEDRLAISNKLRKKSFSLGGRGFSPGVKSLERKGFSLRQAFLCFSSAC
jgi:hypothetical protein